MPPVIVESTGLRFSASTAIPSRVLIKDTLSAPEASAARAISVMSVDAEKRRPVLSTITGGMSGAAVKPIALRMVWQVAKAVNIPVIGLGGIMGCLSHWEIILRSASFYIHYVQ